jgi:hypothetical protein
MMGFDSESSLASQKEHCAQCEQQERLAGDEATMEVTPLDVSSVSRSKYDELQTWRQRQQEQFQLWLCESERLFMMQSQLCEKKKLLLQA